MSNIIRVILENEDKKEVKLFVKRTSVDQIEIKPELVDETYIITPYIYKNGAIDLGMIITYIVTELTGKQIKLNTLMYEPEILYKGFVVERIKNPYEKLFKDYENPEDTEKMIKNLANYIKEKVTKIIEKIEKIDDETSKTYEIRIKLPD